MVFGADNRINSSHSLYLMVSTGQVAERKTFSATDPKKQAFDTTPAVRGHYDQICLFIFCQFDNTFWQFLNHAIIQLIIVK